MPQRLKLYKTNASPPSRAVLMVVEYLGLEMEMIETVPMSGDTKKPEYLEKNPLHTIPFLEDGNFGIPDSHAIILYLVSKYGSEHRSTLYPVDVEVRATVDARLFLDAGILFPRLRNIIMAKFTGSPLKDTDIDNVKEAYGFLEKYLEKTSFLAADNITLADIAAISTVSTLDVPVPIGEEYPKLREWINKITNEDWYQKANVPGLNAIKGFLNK